MGLLSPIRIKRLLSDVAIHALSCCRMESSSVSFCSKAFCSGFCGDFVVFVFGVESRKFFNAVFGTFGDGWGYGFK